MDKLCEHVKESKMQWLSSNMHLQCPGLPPLPTYTIVPMEGKRVAFVGLLSNDMSLYDPGSDPFGGAVIEDPIVVAAHLHDFLMETENVDAVVFLTHQSLEDDVRLALSGNYSVIMGGHDDDEYVGQVNGCWVIKGGMNAVKYELVKLFWPDANATHPTVSVELKLSALHEADPQTQELSEQQHANAAHMGLVSASAVSVVVFIHFFGKYEILGIEIFISGKHCAGKDS